MAQEQWVAIDSSTDRPGWARKLARAHDRVLAGNKPAVEIRSVIRDSWSRCSRSGVDAEHGLAPVEISGAEAASRWDASPLRAAEPVLGELLEDVRTEAQQVVLVCDRDGTLLWIDGEEGVLDAARGVHLEPGSVWSEEQAGTNAMGTALANGHPIQVFSAEHFAVPVHGWTCSATPVRDPETGESLGVLDLSGELSTAHPHSLALVSAAARMVEARLAVGVAERGQRLREAHGGRVGSGRGRALALSSRAGTVLVSARPELAGRRLDIPGSGGALVTDFGLELHAEALEQGGFLLWPSSERFAPAVEVKTLGSDRATLITGGETIELSPRHSEILVLLALRPEGLSAEQIALELYGEFGKPVTARAELSRLRRVIGSALSANPYRLTESAELDFASVEATLGEGRVAEALAAYAGPMLPHSEVPVVVETRQRIDDLLRSAILRSGRPDLLEAWIENPSGRDDVEACRRLLGVLGDGDRRRSGALSRLRRLCGR